MVYKPKYALIIHVSKISTELMPTVPTRIVDVATILGFDLFGAATIQTESTIQWVYYYSDFYIESEKMYIALFCKNYILK